MSLLSEEAIIIQLHLVGKIEVGLGDISHSGPVLYFDKRVLCIDHFFAPPSTLLDGKHVDACGGLPLT